MIEIDGVVYSDDKKAIISVTAAFRNHAVHFPIPDGVEVIYPHAFEDCANLTSVFFPDSLFQIKSAAFIKCKKLEKIEFPRKLHYIESSAFSGCVSLDNLSLNNVKHLGDEVFEFCPLSELSYLGMLETIGVSAFSNNHIRHLYIPKSLINISDYAFEEAFQLSSIVVDKENKMYDSRENCNCLISTWDDRLILTAEDSFFIPSSVKSIDNCALSNSRLKKIIIPEGVELIEGEALYENNFIEELVLPKSLNYIHQYFLDTLSEKLSIVYPGSKKDFFDNVQNGEHIYRYYSRKSGKPLFKFFETIENFVDDGYSLSEINQFFADSDLEK